MNYKISLSILIVVVGTLFLSCDQRVTDPISYEHQLVLVNPTMDNLASVISMMDEKVIDLPETELLVIHYEQVGHRFESNRRFLEENPLPFVSIEQIRGDLTTDNLFRENPCSEAFKRIFNGSDGVLFFGGTDFPPMIYGQKTNLLTAIHTPYRHYFELSFLFHLLGGKQDPQYKPMLEQNPDYVVYGFCLGMQSINVATGGTMYQDIPSEVYGLNYAEDVLEMDTETMHRNYWKHLAPRENLIWCNFHRIQFSENSVFTAGMKLEPDFNPFICSAHHQAAKELGNELIIAATSMDGNIIEAVTHKRFANVLGVQFHPEAFSIYFSEAEKYKRSPADTVLISENDFLKQDRSLEFHKTFWAYFSSLFSTSK